MQVRDLERAAAHLGQGCQIQVPGSATMTRLSDLTAHAVTRYRNVARTCDAIEAMGSPGPAGVFARGTLSDEWLDVTPFDGIRFIDRFELTDGRITRQDVWKDLTGHERQT